MIFLISYFYYYYLHIAYFRLAIFLHPRLKNTASIEEEINLNKPIKFTTSKAANWNSRNLYYSPTTSNPWYQRYSIILSLTIFLIYFTILREENDIDMAIGDATDLNKVKSIEEILKSVEEKKKRKN